MVLCCSGGSPQGARQGSGEDWLFFPFFGNFDGEEDAFKPHSTTGFQLWHWTSLALPDCCARFLQIWRQPILVKRAGAFSLWARFFQSSKVLLFEWKGCRMLQHLGQNRRTSLLLPLDHSVVSMFCQHLADWPNAYLFFGKGWLERLLYFLILLTEQAFESVYRITLLRSHLPNPTNCSGQIEKRKCFLWVVP